MRLHLTLVAFLSLLPGLALAQDAGEPSDAGADADGGSEDAGQVPDASAADDIYERCLDGYNRSHVEACAGKQAGESCTFEGGESGACASLRCLDADGTPQRMCVAIQGQPAPPPTDSDGGPLPSGADAAGDEQPELGGLQGGGCASAKAGSSALLLVGVALLCGRRLARRR